MADETVRIEVNGRDPDADEMALLDHDGWGHFTAMQVRDARTRGLEFHLARLDNAHREIYGHALDEDMVRLRIRQALRGQPDASVRVYGYWAGVIVTVRPPAEMPSHSHSLMSQHFQRPLARLKHSGSWGQGYFRDRAIAAGYDEGLLVDEAGRIAEGTITNVGFWRDGTVTWPDAPRLDGITMLVLRQQLAASGVPQTEATICLADLPGYDGMMLCNARGWALVDRVDDIRLRSDPAFAGLIRTAYEQCPRDVI